jgi:hypothetical protein
VFDLVLPSVESTFPEEIIDCFVTLYWVRTKGDTYNLKELTFTGYHQFFSDWCKWHRGGAGAMIRR